MQKRRVLYFLSAFVVGGAVLGAVAYGFHRELRPSGIFEIHKVPIELISADGSPKPKASKSAERLTEKLRERLEADVDGVKGKRIWAVDLSGLRASLERDDWVKDVIISRALPNEIRIKVRPKNAAAVLLIKQNEFIPVADDGSLLGALQAGDLPDVPVLRGESFSDTIGPEGVRRRAKMIKFLSSLNERSLLSPQNVSEIAWAPSDGYVLTLVQPRIEVKLGDDRVDVKALRVAQVLTYLSVNNLKGRVIDASFSKKVLVRLRKGP